MRNNSLGNSSDNDISFDGSSHGDISFDNDSSHAHHRKLDKSTNTFDDSSDSSDSSDDDDSCFYQGECNETGSFHAEEECEEESIFSEITNPTILESTHTGMGMDDAVTRIGTGSSTRSIGNQFQKSHVRFKRVAPLSFLVQTVDANIIE